MQCYRRGRSVGYRQSRNFSSSTCTIGESKRESQKKAAKWCALAIFGYAVFRTLEKGKMILDMYAIEEKAAKEGKKVAFSAYFSYFGKSYFTTMHYDEELGRYVEELGRNA